MREVLDLSWTRRRVLGSLSRTALVLPFADVLAMAVPPRARAQAQQAAPAAQHDYETKPVAPPPGLEIAGLTDCRHAAGRELRGRG